MKLLALIAAIVSLAEAGQVYHAPADVYQTLNLQAHSPVYQVQLQHPVPPVQEDQGFIGLQGYEGFQGHHIQQEQHQVHQPIQLSPQVTHQHQPKENPQVAHQVYHAPLYTEVHHNPQVTEHHSRKIQTHNYQGLQSHQGHGSHPVQSNYQSNARNNYEGVDKGAKILSYQHDSDGHNYQYGFETDNGIKMQEVGSKGEKGSQAQGAYSYKGDDGQIYTVTYTADENGFHAEGAHLPTPPPMPEEIARSIEQNLKDEANGIVDEGQYQPHHHNGHQQQGQAHQLDSQVQQHYGFQNPKSHYSQPAPISEYQQ